MANQDAAFGMRPVGRVGGTPFTGGQTRYRIAANYGTAIFQGDMEKKLFPTFILQVQMLQILKRLLLMTQWLFLKFKQMLLSL